MNDENQNYQYKGLKLTPAIFAQIIVMLFDGKQFTRQTAVKKILEYHVSHGGIIEEGRDLVAVFKAATQQL